MNNKTLDQMHIWLRCYQPRRHARVQLVCFPPERTPASFYRDWCRRLPVTVELLAAQYPGREDLMPETCAEDIGQLADRAAEALETAAPTRALVLFGHGFGAALAFEVARRLDQCPVPRAVRLFVSGCAPSWDERRGSADNAQENMNAPAIWPVLYGDSRISAACVKLSCPIVAYVGVDDHTVSMDQARLWSNFTYGDFRARSFPGDHFYLQQNVGMVLAELLGSLRLADQNPAVWPASL